MPLLRLEPFTYPYSAAQLRTDEPRLSLSAELPDSELAALAKLTPPVLVVRVVRTAKPADSRELRWVEAQPVQQGGKWTQKWQSRAATPEEEAQWDSLHAPEPDWIGFYSALNTDPEMSGAIEAILRELLPPSPSANLKALGGLYVGLGRAASDGDAQILLSNWLLLADAGLLTPEVVTGVQQLAESYHLPADFIAGLAQ